MERPEPIRRKRKGFFGEARRFTSRGHKKRRAAALGGRTAALYFARA
jgi:hypothetical protein